MTTYRSPLLATLHERGFIHQCTDAEGLDALLAGKTPVPIYIGFDCTAPSLHVGSLMQIMILHWVQQCGHKPIVLMGGGTTKVGDPSGKDEARKLLDDAAIDANMAGIKKTFLPFLTFGSGATDAVMVNNDEWLSGLNYIAFLRDYGRHFSVNRMLSMDSVKLRLEREQNLSFLEFNYMILQAYDFVELQKRYGCRAQIGGSDQWGNIINGVELHRRIRNYALMLSDALLEKKHDAADVEKRLNQESLFGLTSPLITTSSGAKMGKTAAGAVWLDAEMLSPYDYWQFWRNTEDADVGRFLRFFTTLSMEEIKKLESMEGAGINEAKKILATTVTALCHGKAAAEEAAETARKVFEGGGVGDALPIVEVPQAELKDGIAAYALFLKAGLAESGGEARKLVRGGGAKLNDEKIDDENHKITTADLTAEGHIKLSAGKKRHVLVKAA